MAVIVLNLKLLVELTMVIVLNSNLVPQLPIVNSYKYIIICIKFIVELIFLSEPGDRPWQFERIDQWVTGSGQDFRIEESK